jgi:hypothetical protein
MLLGASAHEVMHARTDAYAYEAPGSTRARAAKLYAYKPMQHLRTQRPASLCNSVRLRPSQHAHVLNSKSSRVAAEETELSCMRSLEESW